MLRKLMILLSFLSLFTQCTQEKSKSSKQPSKSGLLIDNGINRGVSYTDAQGNNYNLRYIPITITNDSTTSIKLIIAFLKEYDYPTADDDEQFSIFPMPKEWALDGVEITDNMKNELKNYIDKPFLNTTLKPGEKSVIAIGTLYSRPPKSTGVLPNTLFVHSNSGLFPTCKWVMKKDPSSDPMALGLRLNFGPGCTVIPCGQVSYPDQ